MKKCIAFLLTVGIWLSGCTVAAPPAPSTSPAETTVPAETAIPTNDVPTESPKATDSQIAQLPDFENLTSATAVPDIWAANCEEYISLRKEPRFSEALAYIPVGNTFTLLQWQGTYALVSYEGQEGYVLTNYIKPAEESYFSSKLQIVKPTERYSYEQMLLDLDALITAHPESVSLDTIGTSELGRDIPVLLIGNPDAEYHVLLQGAIHGREHMTAWLLMALADFWLAQDIAEYGDICYHIIPMGNPDGVTIAQAGKLDSTQTQIFSRDIAQGFTSADPAQYTALWKANGLGIDLNRNFPTGWSDLDSRSEPSSQLYRGDAPFCAAETAALRDYTMRYPFDITISYHASGSFIYYEYGNKDHVNLRSESLANAVSTVTGYPLKGSDGVDAAGYKDWAIDSMEIPSLTIEVGCDRAPLVFREIYSIFARNCAIFPAIAQWLLQ